MAKTPVENRRHGDDPELQRSEKEQRRRGLSALGHDEQHDQHRAQETAHVEGGLHQRRQVLQARRLHMGEKQQKDQDRLPVKFGSHHSLS